MSEGEGGLSSSRSSLSISGPVWSVPEDFDAKHYEKPSNLANIVKIQAFIRQQSVQQHYNLICTFCEVFLVLNAVVWVGIVDVKSCDEAHR